MDELAELTLEELDAVAAWGHAVESMPGVEVIHGGAPDPNASHGPGEDAAAQDALGAENLALAARLAPEAMALARSPE